MLHILDPLTDPRWDAFVYSHPAASVFHRREWLKSLRDSYGYEPFAMTANGFGAALDHAIVWCKVSSWMTGRRCISLPFSDHCAVLAPEPRAKELAEESIGQLTREGWANIELRSTKRLTVPHGTDSCVYAWHLLDLTQGLDTLLRGTHPSSTQRKIRRAQREGVSILAGRSPDLLEHFYSLLLHTRRRHRLPPQPKRWFATLVREFGSDLEIRVAFHADRPIASILTLRHNQTLVYKNGCSRQEDHPLGGMQLLLWTAIEAAKDAGLTALDLGRSDLDNPGLIRFKDNWGARRQDLTYLGWAGCAQSSLKANTQTWKRKVAGAFFNRLPARFGPTVGGLVYRHLA